jgi:hypothetical protein
LRDRLPDELTLRLRRSGSWSGWTCAVRDGESLFGGDHIRNALRRFGITSVVSVAKCCFKFW